MTGDEDGQTRSAYVRDARCSGNVRRMMTIELDYVDDVFNDDVTETDVADDVSKWLLEGGFPDVTFSVKQVRGPAGGAAVVEFTAESETRLRELLVAYSGTDDVNELLERARVDV